jgi:uncharacterized Rossmann fold enzyme
LGFDFNSIPGKYSKNKKWKETDLNMKKKKLSIANRIIKYLEGKLSGKNSLLGKSNNETY